MIRNVNLIRHLPSFLQDYRELKVIMDAENPEVQTIEDASEIVKNNLFVLYSDESGVQRYERMFGLTPSLDDSLANRQAKILSLYTNTVTYTMRGLMERLNAVCGVGNYIVELIPSEYRINIILNMDIAALINTIDSMVYDMIPANMIKTYIVDYNKQETLARYPHKLLSQFTHKELYGFAIDDSFSAKMDNLKNHTMKNLESISCENLMNYGMRKV